MKSFRYGITIQRKKKVTKRAENEHVEKWKFQAMVMGLQNADIENNIFVRYSNL